MPAVGEHPDVVVHALNVDLGFIDVYEIAIEYGPEEGLLGGGVVAGQVAEEVDPARRTQTDAEQVLGHLGDDPVRQPKHDSLVDGPRLEGVAEDVVAQPGDGRRVVMPLAFRAETSLALVPRDDFRQPFRVKTRSMTVFSAMPWSSRVEVTVTLGAPAFGHDTNSPVGL